MFKHLITTVLVTLSFAGLPAQGHGHRIPSMDYSIGGVSAMFHVKFLGDGIQPAEIAVLEYNPAVDSRAQVARVALPGAVPGMPISLGNNHWLVGSVTCGATTAGRDAWITRVELLTSGKQCTGVRTIASVSCGAMDPYRLLVDADNRRLWMIDAANEKIRVASYDPAGALPAAGAWTEVGNAGQWANSRALFTAMPQNQSQSSMEWWSPWQMTTKHKYSAQANGAWLHTTVGENEEPISFVGMPTANSMGDWSMTAEPGLAWSLDHAVKGQLASGIVPASGVVLQPGTALGLGLEGQGVVLKVGDRKTRLPIFGFAGRSVAMTGVAIGGAFVARTPIGTHVLPSTPMKLSGVSCSAWLFVGWRDPNTNVDPILWQGDVAVIDAAAPLTAVVPITVSENLLLGELCSRVLEVPDDVRLNGSCVVLQYVLLSGSTYCVSNVVASNIVGNGATATPAQISIANAAWRSSVNQASSPPTMAAILLSLQGR